LLGSLAAFAAGCGSEPAPTTSPASAGADFEQLILQPSQIGPDYTLEERSDGEGAVGYVTLNLCGVTFESEALRTDRLQTNYLPAKGDLPASNEVVSYVRGGAHLALAEVSRVARNCPRGPQYGPVANTGPIRYQVESFADPRLPTGSIALVSTASGEARGRSFKNLRSVIIYFAHGDLLSGVYVNAKDGQTARAKQTAVRAAIASADNLEAHPWVAPVDPRETTQATGTSRRA
jgi:hypothetical protein